MKFLIKIINENGVDKIYTEVNPNDKRQNIYYAMSEKGEIRPVTKKWIIEHKKEIVNIGVSGESNNLYLRKEENKEENKEEKIEEKANQDMQDRIQKIQNKVQSDKLKKEEEKKAKQERRRKLIEEFYTLKESIQTLLQLRNECKKNGLEIPNRFDIYSTECTLGFICLDNKRYIGYPMSNSHVTALSRCFFCTDGTDVFNYSLDSGPYSFDTYDLEKFIKSFPEFEKGFLEFIDNL